MYAIAKHETKAQNRDSLYYNQFYELPIHKKDVGRPVWRNDGAEYPGGYGIFQVSGTASSQYANISREQIWNWQKKVNAGFTILKNKRTVANDWMTSQRMQAGSNVLPSHTVAGVQFADGTDRTMEHAVTMKAYNGASRPRKASFVDPGDPDDFPGFGLYPHYSDHYCSW